MGFYGSSYSSSLAGAGLAAGLTFLLMIVAFVLSIIVYVKFAGAKRDKISKESWSWKKFFTFDTIMVSGILKYLYILSAFEIVASGLGVLFSAMALGGALGLFGGLLSALIIIALGELLCRVIFEFMMLSVKLTENSSIIKNAMTGGFGAVENGLGQSGGMGSMPASAPVAPFAAQGGEAWTCPSCGRKNAKGSFCAGCGGPRA